MSALSRRVSRAQRMMIRGRAPVLCPPNYRPKYSDGWWFKFRCRIEATLNALNNIPSTLPNSLLHEVFFLSDLHSSRCNSRHVQRANYINVGNETGAIPVRFPSLVNVGEPRRTPIPRGTFLGRPRCHTVGRCVVTTKRLPPNADDSRPTESDIHLSLFEAYTPVTIHTAAPVAVTIQRVVHIGERCPAPTNSL